MAYLQDLPVEILDEILEYLDYRELARLPQCSTFLCVVVKDRAIKHKDAPNQAMNWACRRGDLAMIRRAVAYGAPVSTVTITVPKPCFFRPIVTRVMTLYLALRGRHLDAFKLLLQLGARADGPHIHELVHGNLIRHLCKPGDNWVFLRLFLEAGLDRQARAHLCAQSVWPLVPVLLSEDKPLDLVQLLLDRGADPNQIHAIKPNTYVTPLCLAIQANSAPIFNLLISRGAHINGRIPRVPSRSHLHIPILTASAAIPKHGPEMFAHCLRRGADINSSTPILSRTNNQPSLTSPLPTYLSAIETWDTSPSPTHIISGFLTLRTKTPDPGQRDRYPVGKPAAVEPVLQKWGTQLLLTNTHYLSAIDLLISSDRYPEVISRIITNLDRHIRRTEADQSLTRESWALLLNLLLSDTTTPTPTPTNILTELIRAIGLTRTGLGDLSHLAMTHLLDMGADINAPIYPHGPTALHYLCTTYISDWKMGMGFIHGSWEHEVDQQRRRLFVYLLKKGADPTVEFRGMTAVDVLVGGMEGISDLADRYLGGMVRILKGEEGVDGLCDCLRGMKVVG